MFIICCDPLTEEQLKNILQLSTLVKETPLNIFGEGSCTIRTRFLRTSENPFT